MRAVPQKMKKSLLIGIDERKEGERVISLTPRGPVTPEDMFDGLLSALAGLYANVWGEAKGDDALTPEEFCELVTKKLLVRLANFKVSGGTVQ